MRKIKTQCGTLEKVTLKNGTSIWRARFRLYGAHVNGKEKRIDLGYTHSVTEAEARQALADIINRMHNAAKSAREIGAEEVRRRVLEFETGTPPGSRGAAAELIVAADLIAKGYEVYRAVCGTSSCDIVTWKHGEFLRVEIKTETRNCAQDLRRNLGKFDVVAIYSPETGAVNYFSAYELSALPEPKLSGTSAAACITEVIENKPVLVCFRT